MGKVCMCIKYTFNIIVYFALSYFMSIYRLDHLSSKKSDVYCKFFL